MSHSGGNIDTPFVALFSPFATLLDGIPYLILIIHLSPSGGFDCAGHYWSGYIGDEHADELRDVDIVRSRRLHGRDAQQAILWEMSSHLRL